MLEKVYGSTVFGVEATTITVEVNVDKGIVCSITKKDTIGSAYILSRS